MTATMLQTPLFPPGPPPARPTIDVHAISIPARTFTGDFWFTHRAGDHLWFALGDVAGKGLSAALVMAMIQEELEHRIASCASAGCDPATTVQRLHTFLRPLLPRNRFATAVLGWLRDDGTLKLVNAGHCPPMIVRSGGRIEQIGSTGPAIAALPTARWHSVTAHLAPGEKLVLYSDGVSEATSSAGHELGSDGILHALSSFHRPVPARAVAMRILDAVTHHAPGVREDDLTLLVVGRG